MSVEKRQRRTKKSYGQLVREHLDLSVEQVLIVLGCLHEELRAIALFEYADLVKDAEEKCRQLYKVKKLVKSDELPRDSYPSGDRPN